MERTIREYTPTLGRTSQTIIATELGEILKLKTEEYSEKQRLDTTQTRTKQIGA